MRKYVRKWQPKKYQRHWELEEEQSRLSARAKSSYKFKRLNTTEGNQDGELGSSCVKLDIETYWMSKSS